MIREVTGYVEVQKIYLQLLFACNFRCLHCFHGEKLDQRDSVTKAQCLEILRRFKVDYNTREVCFLGGEPFLRKDIREVTIAARDMGYRTEICTNGYKISTHIPGLTGILDNLRVSIDGYRDLHDRIRRVGSYDEALVALETARDCGIKTSITATVTKGFSKGMIELVRDIKHVGTTRIKLHSLRSIGFAQRHPELLPTDDDLGLLRLFIAQQAKNGIEIEADDDLFENPECVNFSTAPGKSLDRVEMSPNGNLYISCKAVGSESNAFRVNLVTGSVHYKPKQGDEVAMPVHQVVYKKRK
jgi:Fe-coproporphyrin III synthase